MCTSDIKINFIQSCNCTIWRKQRNNTKTEVISKERRPKDVKDIKRKEIRLRARYIDLELKCFLNKNYKEKKKKREVGAGVGPGVCYLNGMRWGQVEGRTRKDHPRPNNIAQRWIIQD